MSRRVHLGRRLLVGSVGAAFLALGLAGFLLDRAVAEDLARANAEALEAVLEVGCVRAINEARGPRARRGEVPRLFADDDDAGAPTLWAVRRTGADDELASAPGFPAAALEHRPESVEAAALEVVDGNGNPFRVVTRRVFPADEVPPGPGDRGRPGRRDGPRGRPPGPRGRGPGTFRPDEAYDVFIASSTAEERAARARLRRLIGLTGIGAAAALALILAMVVRVGLRPVRSLAGAIDGLDVGSLDAPLPIDAEVAELAPVTDALRAARVRLLEGFERERRFAGDAAHELRTPLAGLRASLEVALRRERPAAELRETASECLGITLAMQRTADALLALARPGGGTGEAEELPVIELFRAAFEDLGSAMESRGQSLRVDGTPGGLTIRAPRPLVERLAANAAGNAVAHGARGEVIDLSAETADDGVLVRVSNACAAPLPEGIEEFAFQPFWRADGARGVEDGHAGLGLALVKQVSEVLGGEAAIRVEGARFTLEILLPEMGTVPGTFPPVS